MKITNLKQLSSQAVSHNPQIKKKVMLQAGELPNLTNFSQACFPPGQIATAHAHQDMCEVFFVAAGSGIIKIDGKEYLLEPGSCIAVETGEVHEITNNGTEELILTYFGLRDNRSRHGEE